MGSMGFWSPFWQSRVVFHGCHGRFPAPVEPPTMHQNLPCWLLAMKPHCYDVFPVAGAVFTPPARNCAKKKNVSGDHSDHLGVILQFLPINSHEKTHKTPMICPCDFLRTQFSCPQLLFAGPQEHRKWRVRATWCRLAVDFRLWRLLVGL